MEYLIFLFPFGGALAVRLNYHRWSFWAGWGIASLVTFMVIWLSNLLPLSVRQASGAVIGSSFLGFISPEIWEAFRAFLRRPRNIGFILVGAGILYVLSQPQLLGSLMSLGIVCLGFWIIVRPILRR